MEKLFFGTAGTPLSSNGRDSISGIKRVHELGFSCMELEFVRGVKMGEKTALAVRDVAKEHGVKLSVHAPYYINLNAEGEKLSASCKRIMDSARIGHICGAKSVVIHAAFYQGKPKDEVYGRVRNQFTGMCEELRDEGLDIALRVETMGRGSQFGSIEEVLEITEVEGVLPCIDFSHLHAINGRNNSEEEFAQILTMVEDKLGREGLDDMHIHVSGIEYSEKGERKHLVLEESDFNYRELVKVFSDFDIKGLVICESPNLETDALALKSEYDSLRR